MAEISATIASYIASSTFEALPAAIRREGVRAFVNWVGCAAGGSHEDIVERALGFLAEFGGAATATLVGRPERLDALNATYVNALSSTVLMFNDTHAATVAHPTGPVAAALLALAERQPLSGREFLHALILGIEIQCRVGNILCVPPAECAAGLSMGGLVGGIGAAAAAAKVLGLDAEGTATAIGLAANHAAGLRQAHASMANSLTPAHAARCGLMAALMAARGVTCSEGMIEGPKGFAASYATRPNLASAVDGLGRHFEIAALSYKPYPSGFVSHPVIDVCLEIAQQDGFDAARVERIELTVSPLVAKLMDRPAPENPAEAVMSVQHWAAVSLICRAAGIAQTTAAVARMPDVVELRRRVALKYDPATGSDAARVEVLFKNGSKREARVLHCRGSAECPLSDDDITQKTRGQLLMAFSVEIAESIIADCWRIEEMARAGALCDLLRTGDGRRQRQ